MRFTIAMIALLAASPAAAQTTPAPADAIAPSQLIVEKIESGWVFAPDVRFADLDGKAGTLAGGYVGRITDRTLTFGGGGYWLTNRDDDFKMAYGGAVVQWMGRVDRAIGFGFRALVGGGSATLSRPLGELFDLDAINRHGGRSARFGALPVNPTTPVAVADDFFIIEPQADLRWNLSPRLRIQFGVGYRAIGAAQYLGDQLRGASGSISLELWGGS